MSTRRPSATMNSSRPRNPMDTSRKPRHSSRTQADIVPPFSSHLLSGMTHQGYLASGSDFYPEISTGWPVMTDAYFTGNDSAHIPTLSVAPTELTHQSCWDTMPRYNFDSPPSSGSSSSPPMSEAEIMHVDMPFQSPTDQFGHFDPWVQEGPLTPPMDPMFDDNLELFNTGKNDLLGFPSMGEPAPECEYLGISKLQFSSAPSRHSQPRPIRSASERSPPSSASGSPHSRFAKDDRMERTKYNPRSDPRYEEKADKDGYYHCPYAAEGCNHKPTKQKCIYAKNLDSHLKPYTCKHGATDDVCRNLRFSSNACLFRHEREMHGMHNHGLNPYLCKFQGCERARPDNGFPRRWNQRDHMKRVHGHEEFDSDESTDRGYTESAGRRKKSSSASHHVPMKRTGSSRAQANTYPGLRNVSAPRYVAQASRELHARNPMIPGMNHQDVSFTPMLNPQYSNYVHPVY